MQKLTLLLVLTLGSVQLFAQAAAAKPQASSAPATAASAQATATPTTASTPAAGAIKVNPKDGLTYVWIAAGKFQMGCSPNDQDCGDDEKPLHEVTITKGFWLGQTLVTQSAYQKLIGNNPSHYHGDKLPLPVETITWNDAVAYCTAAGMRLPTEAEWEYAARAGDANPVYGKLESIAWVASNSGGTTRPVAKKQPNAWKLNDMIGNLWEWTADFYARDYYQHSEKQDPKGPKEGEDHPLRGGCWNSSPDIARASQRVSAPPSQKGANVGFRCAGD